MPRPLSVTAEIAVGLQLDLDEGGVARQRLVHGVVDDFGEQMMQRLLVGAADIHAGPAAHRLQPLQHLDVGGGIAGLARRRADLARRGIGGGGTFRIGPRGSLFARRAAEEIAIIRHE